MPPGCCSAHPLSGHPDPPNPPPAPLLSLPSSPHPRTAAHEGCGLCARGPCSDPHHQRDLECGICESQCFRASLPIPEPLPSQLHGALVSLLRPLPSSSSPFRSSPLSGPAVHRCCLTSCSLFPLPSPLYSARSVPCLVVCTRHSGAGGGRGGRGGGRREEEEGRRKVLPPVLMVRNGEGKGREGARVSPSGL